MLPFGETIPAPVPQGSEFPEGLMNNPVLTSTVNGMQEVHPAIYLLLKFNHK
jgi:hypothetical protein